MNNDLKVKSYFDEYSNWKTERLHKELEKEDKLAHDHLMRLIAIVKILDSRGEEIKLPTYKKNLYKKLAYGQISIRAYTKFIGSLASRYIFRLPIKEQEYFASGGQAEVYNPEIKKVEKRPVSSLNPYLLRQVFKPKGIRRPEEQEDYYRKQKTIEKREGLFVDSDNRDLIVRVKGYTRKYNFEKVREIFSNAGYSLIIKSK